MSNQKQSSGINRRTALKSLGLAGAAALLPTSLSSAVSAHASTSHDTNASPSQNKSPNPKWYGFNLLEYFSTDPDWMKYFPYKNDGLFPEDDFRWIRDWGFNWVRLPMDYRFWTDSQDFHKISEEKVAPIDRAIKLGEKYGVHINICLHRAPGYCILDLSDESVTGIHVTKEKSSVFTDPKMLDAFVYQWSYFARRYKGISSEKLSFNLVNEPLIMPGAEEIEELKKEGKFSSPADLFKPEIMQRHAGEYARVAQAAIAEIRKQDPQRLVVTDGYVAGTAVIPDLYATGVTQSCHTYHPMQVTHYQCEWARGMLSDKTPAPTWPTRDAQGTLIDRAALTHQFAPWSEPPAHGVPIHFGEMGCYKHTPPEVVLAWFDDTLSVVDDLHSGWALWNFRGPFGVLDTERAGTKFEDWHGHQLDRQLLLLLQRKMKG
jgi:endoglucanase